MIVTVPPAAGAVYVAEHTRLFPLGVHDTVPKELPALPSLNVVEPVGTFVGVIGSVMVAVTRVWPPAFTEVGLRITAIEVGSSTFNVAVPVFPLASLAVTVYVPVALGAGEFVEIPPLEFEVVVRVGPNCTLLEFVILIVTASFDGNGPPEIAIGAFGGVGFGNTWIPTVVAEASEIVAGVRSSMITARDVDRYFFIVIEFHTGKFLLKLASKKYAQLHWFAQEYTRTSCHENDFMI